MEKVKSRSTATSGETQLDAFLKTNPASTGVLAGVVTMSGQLAAQFEMPSLGCRIVALIFALLLAYYQVGIAQRRPRNESLFLVPIVAVILFTTGWGANRLLYEADVKLTKEAAQTVSHSPQASLGEWLAEKVIPAAHAQSGGAQTENDQNKEKRSRWRNW